jgi:hypothetical protein
MQLNCQNLIFRPIALFLIPLIAIPGCKSSQPAQQTTQPAASSASAPPPAATTPTTDVATTPASATTTPATAAPISIDDLVAPIALYPDQLLGQLLVTATNPQEVLDLGNWLVQNQNLTGDAAVNAAKAAGFSASAQYLAAFPQIVDNMCQQMDWTTQLGEAFKADQKGVMDAIQRKRAEAQQMGNLQSGPQLTVASTTQNGQSVVQIQPTNPQTVYVPQYNPETVYTSPAPTTTTVVQQSGVSTGTAVGIGLLSFGVGMAVGSLINRNNYYPAPSWGYGGMYYGGRPYYPPPYRPPVYAGYRPAYGYAPPPNYRWNQYNRQVNVHVNNNNYYNRVNNSFRANPNNRYAGARNVGAPNQNFRGQTTYSGARPQAQGQRPGASMARVNPSYPNRPQGNLNQRPGVTPARSPNPSNRGQSNQFANRNNNVRPQNGNAASAGNNAAQRNNRPANNNASFNRPSSSQQNASQNRPSPSAKPQQSQNRPSSSARPQQAQNRPNNNTRQNSTLGAARGNNKPSPTAANRSRPNQGANRRQPN